MKTFYVLPFILGVACLAHADIIVGSGHVVSETRTISEGFHSVDLHGSGIVILTQGDTMGVVVEAEDNLLPLIESTVGDGVLRLGFKLHAGDSVSTKRNVVYRVAAKALDHLSVEGSGRIHAASLATGDLKISLPGSGEVGVDRLRATAVKVELDGSGDVKLEGESSRLDVRVDGSGTCYTGKLKTGTAEVEINGSGAVSVNASETLKVQVNGSGDVHFFGRPKITREINGSGGIFPDSNVD